MKNKANYLRDRLQQLADLRGKTRSAVLLLLLLMASPLSASAGITNRVDYNLHNLPVVEPAKAPMLVASLLEDEKRPNSTPLPGIQGPLAPSSWAFYTDNDVLLPTASDRDYTGGVSLTYSSPEPTTHVLSMDGILAKVNNIFGLEETADTLFSYEVGMTAFTPDDIEAVEPLQDDRPYASLVYSSNTRQYIRPLQRSSIISSLTIGVLGLDIVGKVQNSIHKQLGAKEARGWDNQISNGGELTFRYSVSKQNIHQSSYTVGGNNYEIKTSRKLNVGYLSDVSWSVSGRMGHLRAPWWTFNPQTTEYAEKTAPLTDTNTVRTQKEFYVWAGMSLHLRAYNALLQGQFKDSVVTYHSDELNRLIGEAWVGVTKEFESGIRFSYFVRGQTEEIKTGKGSRNLVWGGIIVSQTL